MSLALALFKALCDVGNALEHVRDTYTPASSAWLWHTELLGRLDEAIDLLVHSDGLGGDDDG